jgi:hypothetical protein
MVSLCAKLMEGMFLRGDGPLLLLGGYISGGEREDDHDVFGDRHRCGDCEASSAGDVGFTGTLQ